MLDTTKYECLTCQKKLRAYKRSIEQFLALNPRPEVLGEFVTQKQKELVAFVAQCKAQG